MAEALLQSRILIVDDQIANVRLLERILRGEGYHHLATVTDPREAIDTFRRFAPDLVLLDLIMRPVDGLQILAQIKPLIPAGAFLPVLVLTADNSPETRHRALTEGASDFLTKPLDALEVALRIGILLRTRQLYSQLEHQNQTLEETVRERTRQIREQARLMDLAGDALIAQDMNNCIIYWNKGAERLYGWSPEEALGQNAAELLGTDRTQEEWVRSTLRETGEWDGELHQRRRDGGELIVHQRRSLVRDESAVPFAQFAVNTDVTVLKSLQRQLYRAQRLESVGALASGIAHDLNNMLTPILMGVGMLKNSVKDPFGAPLLETIQLSAFHGSGLVRQLLTFVRGASEQHRDLYLPALLKELTVMLTKTFPKNIEIINEVPNDLPPVRIDVTQMYQIVMNLAINARDAMPAGGTLTFRGMRVELDEAFASHLPEAKPGVYVRLSVCDTGVGIAPEVQSRVFEPFFTTKGDSEGTGLGLSTCVDICRGRGGFITLHSSLGGGSRFEVYLPASDTIDPEKVEPDHAPEGRGELLLIVEDEASIREVMRTTLEASGYQVLAAGDDQEALELLERYRKRIALVVADLLMPGLDGLAFAQLLHEREIPLGVVLISGDPSLNRATAPNVRAKLSKPFTANQLLRTLREVLEGGQAGG
jgi:PAS domain S-box-containing protein